MKQNPPHLSLVQPGIELPGPGVQTPRLADDISIAKGNGAVIAKLEDEFLCWFQEKHGTGLESIQFSHLLSWAQGQGLRFTPEVFALLSAVFENIQGLVRQIELEKILFDSLPKQFRWTDFFKEQVAAEIEENELERGRLKLDLSAKNHENPDSRDERLKQQVSAALNFRVCSKDSAAVKDLDWLLTTNNIPSA